LTSVFLMKTVRYFRMPHNKNDFPHFRYQSSQPALAFYFLNFLIDFSIIIVCGHFKFTNLAQVENANNRPDRDYCRYPLSYHFKDTGLFRQKHFHITFSRGAVDGLCQVLLCLFGYGRAGCQRHKKNYQYFEVLQDQRKDGGLEALCYDLIHFKGSEINLRNPPTTDGFNEQKTLSLESVPAFWRNVLERGYILTPPRGDWQDDPTTSTIKADNQAAPGDDQMFTNNHTPVNSDNAPCTVPYEWEEDVKIRQPFINDEYIRYCKSINERFPKKSQSFWTTTRREGKGASPIFRVGVDFISARKTRARFFIAKGLGQMRTAFMNNVCAVEWEGGGEGDEEDVPF
jgi:hypothetical protein